MMTKLTVCYRARCARLGGYDIPVARLKAEMAGFISIRSARAGVASKTTCEAIAVKGQFFTREVAERVRHGSGFSAERVLQRVFLGGRFSGFCAVGFVCQCRTAVNAI